MSGANESMEAKGIERHQWLSQKAGVSGTEQVNKTMSGRGRIHDFKRSRVGRDSRPDEARQNNQDFRKFAAEQGVREDEAPVAIPIATKKILTLTRAAARPSRSPKLRGLSPNASSSQNDCLVARLIIVTAPVPRRAALARDLRQWVFQLQERISPKPTVEEAPNLGAVAQGLSCEHDPPPIVVAS